MPAALPRSGPDRAARHPGWSLHFRDRERPGARFRSLVERGLLARPLDLPGSAQRLRLSALDSPTPTFLLRLACAPIHARTARLDLSSLIEWGDPSALMPLVSRSSSYRSW